MRAIPVVMAIMVRLVFVVVMVVVGFTVMTRMPGCKVSCFTQGSVRWDVINRGDGEVVRGWIFRTATATVRVIATATCMVVRNNGSLRQRNHADGFSDVLCFPVT